MRIQVLHAGNTVTGYGRMAAEICAAFERQGVEVVRYQKDQPPEPYIMFMTPPHRPEGWYKGQHVSIFTMWECTELPFEHLTTVPVFDTVFVPSKQNEEMFARLNDDVKMVGLGCNYDEWQPVKRTYSDPFTIITGGKGGKRKGVDVAIRVFKRFRDKRVQAGYPHPRLIIRSAVSLSNPDPDIIVMDDMLPAEDEIALYANAHVFLGLSRGEGWGMIPHQTIAQGMPTILTNAHGHAEFAKYGLPVGWDWVDAETDIVGRSGKWWDPDENEAFEALMQVAYNYDDHVERALLNAEKIREEFSWDRTAKEILDHLPSPGKITDEWFDCPQTRLEVRVTRDCPCNIGPYSYHFKPGETHMVTADVKRVLFDAGYLDDDCIDVYERALFQTPRNTPIDEAA